VVNTISGKCAEVKRLAGSSLEDASSKDFSITLQHCNFEEEPAAQRWDFVGMAQIATMHGLAGGRYSLALASEDGRRHAVSSSRLPLLTLGDVVRGLDPGIILDGTFWTSMRKLFGTVTSSWNGWGELFELFSKLNGTGPVQKSLGIAYISNFLSTMTFAGMNFVEGFPRPQLLPWWQGYHLNLASFRGLRMHFCGPRMSGACIWGHPVAAETIGVEPLADYIRQTFDSGLPNRTLFDNMYTARSIPSHEDDGGLNKSLHVLRMGVIGARQHGVEPMVQVREMTAARFAFDTEGLMQLLDAGFGWFKLRETKYASNGAFGVGVLERLMQKYKDPRDVLGLLMTESVLSAHLSFNGTLFEADLTMFERYPTLPGFAPLGGKAYFKEEGGRLHTVRLEYGGRIFETFTNEESDKAFVNSKFTHWRFARAAIIASLLAKTQLIMHVKAIHLELAPTFQAVTVDSFAHNVHHPMRRLLEPFISRSVQASRANVELWFQFRAGEFALAPLDVKTQLQLMHDMMDETPLNLADLDMERYATVRGMEQFSQGRRLRETAKETWHWTWHYRALTVQRLMEEYVSCWLERYYSTTGLNDDQDLVEWWHALLRYMPALQVAAERNGDWLTSSVTEPPATASASTTAAATADQATTGTPKPAQTTTEQGSLLDWLFQGQSLNASADTGVALRKLSEAKASGTAPVPLPLPALSKQALTNVLRTLLVWVSWVHEDVGHAAAAFLYDPVYTPMFVPADGEGIPVVPYAVSVAMHRSVMIVERGKLLSEPADSWFNNGLCDQFPSMFNHCRQAKGDRQCFSDFQEKLHRLGAEDDAFQKCDRDGFYSCVDRVETSASS
jgi:hypothetical protein